MTVGATVACVSRVSCFLCQLPASPGTVACRWCSAVGDVHPIVAWHESRGGSYRDLAKRVGGSERHLRALATGENAPSLNLAMRLSVQLGVRVEDLDFDRMAARTRARRAARKAKG